MAGIFVIDREGVKDYEMWDVPTVVFRWAVHVLAIRVHDDELREVLREFQEGGYAYTALTNFTPEQATEIVRVVREDFLPAVEISYPSVLEENAGWHQMIGELVGMAERWSKAS